MRPTEKNKFILLAALSFFLWPFLRGRRGQAIPRKILVVPVSSRIGDVVCATPVFKAIKLHCLDAHLSVFVARSAYGVIKWNPRIDSIINLNDVPFKGWRGRWRLLKFIRRKNFDAVVTLTNNPLGSLLALWSGAPLRIKTAHFPKTWAERLTDWWNNILVEYRDHTFLPAHYLKLLQPLDIYENKVEKEIFPSPSAALKTKRYLLANGVSPADFVVGVALSAGNKIKEWPQERFADLCLHLAREFRAVVVFLGSPADENKIESVRQNLRRKGHTRTVSATNFTLEEVPEILKRFNLFISVDTGPIYIAHALGVPLIDILGPIDPTEQPPADEKSVLVLPNPPSRPSSFVMRRPGKTWEHKRAVENTSVESVFGAVLLLRGRGMI